MSFGQRLRERRRELGISQGELARALGVSLSAVSNYENGQNEMCIRDRWRASPAAHQRRHGRCLQRGRSRDRRCP